MRTALPFLPDMYETHEECRWVLADFPGLSMNDAFIAAPSPSQDRAGWLAAMREYREKLRVGTGGQERLIRVSGSRARIRMSFHPARSLLLRPGQELTVAAEARWEKGANELRIEFDEADPRLEVQAGKLDGNASLSIPRDRSWHRVETRVTVPASADPAAVLRPCVSLPAGTEVLTGIDVRGLRWTSVDAADAAAAEGAADRGSVRALHDRADLRWASRIFTCHFTFLYDRSLYEPGGSGWKVDELVREGIEVFGGYDAVVLWQAYPRIGVDQRNQFDHYRDLPGGLDGLRAMVRRLHEYRVRAFIDYNPWDIGTRRESVGDVEALASLVGEIEADGIFLDTMLSAPASLRDAVDRARPGVILAPEGHPSAEQLALCNASWAQWLADPTPPGALRLKWIEPRHMQHQVRRWDTDHRGEIETAFFNGSGMLVWENVFGTYNPWSAADCALWKRAVGILRAFGDLVTGDGWDPFIPTRAEGIFAHRWLGDDCALYTVRNTGHALRDTALFDIVDMAPGAAVFDLWNGSPAVLDGGRTVVGNMDGIGCWFVGRKGDARARALLAGAARLAATAVPRKAAASVVRAKPTERTPPVLHGIVPAGMVLVPGGAARLLIQHTRRECGCYPDPGTEREHEKRFLWGSPFEETLTHDYSVELPPYFIDEAQVSNAQFKRFLSATGWQPAVTDGFLAHWPAGRMPDSIAELPVVHVDLEDARAYARWVSRRLPTEPEWHLAAQGGDGRAWPWGAAFDASRCAPGGTGPMPVRSLPEGRSPFGCYHMSGNVWEWTESERDDGHTRFAILRGGSWFRPEGSLWYVQGGQQPCTSHAKLLLLGPRLDRSATIGFRCAADAPGAQGQ